MNVLIRCDGSTKIGMGHVVRCLALAQELHNRHKCNITFVMRSSKLGINEISKAFPVIAQEGQSGSFNYEDWMKDCIKETRADVLILDARDGMPRMVLGNIKQSFGVKIVTFEDFEDKRLEADLAFYPPVPQVKRMDWTGFTGELKIGWEWTILRKEFARIAMNRANNKLTYNNKQLSIPVVLITMGGSDPQGMTLKVIEALEKLDESFDVVVVLGIGFQYEEKLCKLLSNCIKHRFDIHKNVQNMAELMLQSDLAVASFGVTAYELAVMGVPAVYLCLTEDHVESASVFVKEKAAVSLGNFANVSNLLIAEKVNQLLSDRGKTLEMSDCARRLIDGQGLERIAGTIIDKFKRNFRTY